jgi:RNA polymerase sigma factor (sigma-70 family)
VSLTGHIPVRFTEVLRGTVFGSAGNDWLMGAGRTDAEVIAASCADPEQFTLIFDRHFRTIHHYLARRVGTDTADDLAATTFTEAFAQRTRYERDRPDARPWLYGIATNLCRRHRRTERRKLRAFARSGIDPLVPDDTGRADARMDALATGPAIAGALASLSLREREVLLLFARGDLSYSQVAQSLGIPDGTVRSRLNRARRKVREQLGMSGQSPDETAVMQPTEERWSRWTN